MKFTEFVHKYNKTNNFPFYIVSGSEYFLKKQALMEIKKRFFSEGGVEQGLIEYNGKDTDRNFAGNLTEGNNLKNAGPSTLFYDVIDEVKTTPMFGKHKLIIVENADTFLGRDQDKVLGYLKNPCSVNCLDFRSLIRRQKDKIGKGHGRQTRHTY